MKINKVNLVIQPFQFYVTYLNAVQLILIKMVYKSPDNTTF